MIQFPINLKVPNPVGAVCNRTGFSAETLHTLKPSLVL